MKVKLPFMPMWWGDYDVDTSHLTQGQHGAYVLLIKHYWTKRRLTSDVEQCYCIARAHDDATRANVDFILGEFFTQRGPIYSHKRIEEELAKAEKKYKKRAGAAKKRWENHPEQRRSKASALHVQSESESQKSIKEKKKRPQTTPLIDALPDWLPIESWNAWLEIRKKVKAANTDYALKLALKKLADLKAQGHAPELVLNNAIEGSWKSLYPPKTEGKALADAPRFDPRCTGRPPDLSGDRCTREAVSWPGMRRNGYCRECETREESLPPPAAMPTPDKRTPEEIEASREKGRAAIALIRERNRSREVAT